MRHFLVTATLVSLLPLVTGCSETSTPAPSAQTQASHSDHGHEHGTEDGHDHAANDHEGEHEKGHAHGAGPHGGTLTDWGGGAYHVEFSVDHDKKEAIAYIVGSDEKSPSPIKADNIQLVINDPMTEMTLVAKPLDGEAEGTSSRFVGTHDTMGIVKEFSGTLSGQIDGTPYTGDFQEEAHTH